MDGGEVSLPTNDVAESESRGETGVRGAAAKPTVRLSEGRDEGGAVEEPASNVGDSELEPDRGTGKEDEGAGDADETGRGDEATASAPDGCGIVSEAASEPSRWRDQTRGEALPVEAQPDASPTCG